MRKLSSKLTIEHWWSSLEPLSATMSFTFSSCNCMNDSFLFIVEKLLYLINALLEMIRERKLHERNFTTIQSFFSFGIANFSSLANTFHLIFRYFRFIYIIIKSTSTNFKYCSINAVIYANQILLVDCIAIWFRYFP